MRGDPGGPAPLADPCPEAESAGIVQADRSSAWICRAGGPRSGPRAECALWRARLSPTAPSPWAIRRRAQCARGERADAERVQGPLKAGLDWIRHPAAQLAGLLRRRSQPPSTGSGVERRRQRSSRYVCAANSHGTSGTGRGDADARLTFAVAPSKCLSAAAGFATCPPRTAERPQQQPIDPWEFTEKPLASPHTGLRRRRQVSLQLGRAGSTPPELGRRGGFSASS
jgi:hypothetical protein